MKMSVAFVSLTDIQARHVSRAVPILVSPSRPLAERVTSDAPEPEQWDALEARAMERTAQRLVRRDRQIAALKAAALATPLQVVPRLDRRVYPTVHDRARVGAQAMRIGGWCSLPARRSPAPPVRKVSPAEASAS